MKILYVVYSFNMGGTEKLLINICNNLVKSNDIYMLIINNHYDKKLLNNFSSEVKIKLLDRKIGKNNKIKTSYQVYKFIKDNKIDIVHCNSLNSPELLWISKLLIPRIKIFYTIHGINQYSKLKKIQKVYRNIICKKIIAISKSVKNDLENNGVKSNKISLIYNGINTGEFCVSKKQFDINNIIIGNVARMDPDVKGQDILLKAIPLLKEKYPYIRCLFAGAPNDNSIAKLEAMKKFVTQNGLEYNVSFVGNIDDVKHFLSGVDIFILPSRNEGFGLSIIEAMSMGIPCIASDVNGPSEIVENVNNGFLFETENIEDLYKRIDYVIDNFEIIKNNSITAIPKVKQLYDIQVVCDKLIEQYRG